MAFTTLISPAEVAAHLDDPDWAIVDCRFALADPAKGRRDYLAAHIPGAVYAHLDEDLSAPIIPGQSGRHPLPAIDDFAAKLSQWGIDDRTQVVVYDDNSGFIAGRLWWMLRWLGHDAAALLDGDWRLWLAEERPTRADVEMRAPRTFVARPRPHLLATADEITAKLGDPALHLFDVRMAERYRGENETIDPVAGHIPGAVNAPYTLNLDADGRFLAANELRERYEALLGDAPVHEAIFYCGSGVSAVHDLLALEIAGLGMGRLYAGSWSEWIADPARPVATGSTP
ncbi:MAG: putative 3-mercaptopyruvate sulfurtransferase [Chloroflexota bacterium]|nr:sulfurtransferase [Caldilinea sp.]GIK71506.1 MAG: putative 3-mercaptopyruvate sulfurtransferase [Chloroflexota bacterium]